MYRVHSLPVFTALSPHCLQRFGGLAKRRLSLNVLRATSVHVRTTFSAELHPRLRQTARCMLVICL